MADPSNTFSAVPYLTSPLTESGLTVSFELRHPGYVWAMIVPREAADGVTRADVQTSTGALGSSLCRYSNVSVAAFDPQIWVLSGCLLDCFRSYTVMVYASGIGGHADGTLFAVEDEAGPASNAFVAYPTIVGVVTGDGFAIEFVPSEDGYAWMAVTTGASGLTIPAVKGAYDQYFQAVGADSCSALGLPVTGGVLQEVNLSGCAFNSGPEYKLHVYVEGLDGVGNDGSFAGSLGFQVKPSNSFAVYPVITSAVTGLGLTCRFAAWLQGYFWSVLQEDSAEAATFTSVKSAANARGGLDCRRSREPLLGNGTVQEVACEAKSTPSLRGPGSSADARQSCRAGVRWDRAQAARQVNFSNCSIIPDRLYHLSVYIEDSNGNNDGVLSLPVDTRLDFSNAYQGAPRVAGAPRGPVRGVPGSFAGRERSWAPALLAHALRPTEGTK
ncbi:unnamed protein product [Prorocentrum cordatum]|uniref:Uncharacterized protein n=1 Tax=Prorocentrum cordatum TaxID=2364126 RepID=A0ABN9UQ02_9DINO|nr:unnamed protein product [Polarella glacialis]